MSIERIKQFFRRTRVDVWEYGICHNLIARRHKKKGNVQMILWKAGQQGHKEDYWHNFDRSWWNQFIPNNKS